MARKIVPLALEDGILLLEGSKVELSNEVISDFLSSDRTARGGERTSAGDPKELASKMRRMIQAVSSTISSSVEAANPDEWQVEFSLGADIQTGIPFIVSNNLEGAIKVKLAWKSDLKSASENV